MTFNELNLSKRIVDAITKAGYKEPSPIQEQAIPLMMEGRDLIACAQTGTGKTAAFALPVLNMLDNESRPHPRALVLTPTRELAIQILENFKKYGRYMRLHTVCFYGGAKQGPQIGAYERGCDVLVATPGRLLDYMNQGIVSLRDIEIFILDEADRMLDMGFIHDIRKVVAEIPEERQTVMFSATMPKEIEALAKDILHDPESIKIAPTTSPAETVDQKICFLEKDNKKIVLSDFLKQDNVKKSIIFTRTKHGADHLVRDLGKLGIESMAIHGNKTQGQRQNALERFRSGNIKVLIATDVASRGIDIPKISHVFNYDLPEETESYIHRIGRAGRAGETGESITLCSKDEMGLLYDIEKMMQKEIPELETELSVSIERVQRGERRRFGRAVAAAKASGREDRKKSATRRSGRVKEDVRNLTAKKPETKSENETFERKSVKADRFPVKKNEEKLRKLKDQKKASQKKTGFEKFYKKNGDIFEEATKAFENKQKNHSGKKIKEETGKKKEHKRRAS
ncbi:MAG: DEAD/DEAH box helicase [Oribacterium sp.]|nr:DEAD/DEAH box helicase [Oribacterium sp.]